MPKLQKETKINMIGVQAERIDDFEPNAKKRVNNNISNGGGGDVRHKYRLKGESDMNEHMDEAKFSDEQIKTAQKANKAQVKRLRDAFSNVDKMSNKDIDRLKAIVAKYDDRLLKYVRDIKPEIPYVSTAAREELEKRGSMNEHMDDGVGPWVVKYSKDGEQEIDRFKDGDKAKEYAEMMRGQGYEVDVSSVNEGRINEMTLTKQDKAVLDKFSDGKEATSKNLTSTGDRLDGNWTGGRGIATWNQGFIYFEDLGSKTAQQVQKALRKMVPNNWIHESVVSEAEMTMKKSELKKIIQECIIEEQNAMMIEEGFFDVFRKLKDAFKTKLYNHHFEKNPEEWLKYLEKIESITKQEQMKKYAGDRQKIDRMLKRIKLLVKQNEFDEALKLSKMLDKSLDKFKNMKAFQ